MTQMNETVEEVAKHVLEDVYHGDVKVMEEDLEKYFEERKEKKNENSKT